MGGGGVKNYQKLRDVIYGRPMGPQILRAPKVQNFSQSILDNFKGAPKTETYTIPNCVSTK